MGRTTSATNNQILSGSQITSYLLAVQLDAEAVDHLDSKVFKSAVNPDGIESISMRRLKTICTVIQQGHLVWEPDDKYHFLVDSKYTDDYLLSLMIRFVNTPVFEVLSTQNFTEAQTHMMSFIVGSTIALGKSPMSVSWVIDPRLTDREMVQLFETTRMFMDSAIGFIMQYADINEFKIPLFDLSGDLSPFDCLCNAYLALPRAFLNYPLSSVFTSYTCSVPGFCVGFFKAVSNGFSQIFTDNLDNPELAVELYNWSEAGFSDATLVLLKIQQLNEDLIKKDSVEVIDAPKLLAAYRRFRVKAAKRKLPTPAGLYQYHSIPLIDALAEAYSKGLLTAMDFMSFITLSDVEEMLEASKVGHRKRASSNQVKSVMDYQLKHFEFDFSKCAFVDWEPSQISRLQIVIKRLTVLQNYPLTENTPSIRVYTRHIWDYKAATKLNPNLEAEITLPAEEFGGMAILVAVRLPSTDAKVPDITIYY